MTRSETKERDPDPIEFILDLPRTICGEDPKYFDTTIVTDNGNVHCGTGSTPEEAERMASNSYHSSNHGRSETLEESLEPEENDNSEDYDNYEGDYSSQGNPEPLQRKAKPKRETISIGEVNIWHRYNLRLMDQIAASYKKAAELYAKEGHDSEEAERAYERAEELREKSEALGSRIYKGLRPL